MGSHPSAGELADFLRSNLLSRAKQREIVRHLLTGCASCSTLLEDLNGKGEAPPFLRNRATAKRRRLTSGPLIRFDYDAAFSAAAQTLRLFLHAGRPVTEPPKAILAELGRLYEEIEPELCALTPERSAIPFLVHWLIEKSHSCRYAAPGEMFEWALMSRLVAHSCPPAIAGSTARLADLMVCAEAQLANALRVLGRSDEAAAVMSSAWANLQRGSGGPELRACLLRQEAALSIRLKSFERAFESLGEAEALLRDLGLRQELMKTGIVQAVACLEAGEPERAAHILEMMLPSIAASAATHLSFVLCNNLGTVYTALGEQQRALAALSAAREAAGDRDRRDSAWSRLLWNEGKLLVALGMPEPAEQAFSRVRLRLFGHSLLLEWILVTQDLVRVQHELGKRDAAEQNIAATSSQVRHRRGGPEVLQALHHLQLMA